LKGVIESLALWKGYSVIFAFKRKNINEFIGMFERLYLQDYEAAHRIMKFFFERLLEGKGITAE